MPQDATRDRILAAVPIAAVLLLIGVALVVTGVLFAAWPAVLAGAGFISNPSAIVRVMAMLFFTGSGALALLMGYGLLRSWPFAWRRFGKTTMVIAVAASGLIWRHPGDWLPWAALIASAASFVLFLRVRRGLPDDLR